MMWLTEDAFCLGCIGSQLPTSSSKKAQRGGGLHLGDRKLISAEVDHDRQLRCSHPRTSANVSQVSAVQMCRDFRWN